MTGEKNGEVHQKEKHEQLYEGVVGGGDDPYNLFPRPQYRRHYTVINLFLNYLYCNQFVSQLLTTNYTTYTYAD
jgi:hypothetical protein